jgi:hypothetical protein
MWVRSALSKDRLAIFFFVPHRTITTKSSFEHSGEHGDLAIYVVDNPNLAFSRMQPMQSSGILHERAFPRNRQRKEQSVQAGIVESFPDVSAGCQQEALFFCWNRSELFLDFTPLFRRPSSPKNDDMPDKAL